MAKAAQAGFQIFIEDEESQLVGQLLQYAGVSESAAELIDRLRQQLAADIRNSRVMLAPIPPEKDKTFKDVQISQHPSIGIMEVPEIVDAIVSDDRYFNKFGHVEVGGRNISLLSTSDLFNTLSTNDSGRKKTIWSHRMRMRQANFMLMALEADELSNFLGKANIKNGEVVETAELRSIRENWQSAKMYKAAVLPNDATWLHSTLKNIEFVLKAQWNDEIPDPEARAKSNWLLALREMSGWSSSFEIDVAAELPEFMSEVQILTLLSPAPDTSEDAKTRYWQWIETEILDDLRLNEPVTFNKVTTMVSDGLIRSAERFPGDTE